MYRLVEPNSRCEQDDVQNEMEFTKTNWKLKGLQESFKYIKTKNNLENEEIKLQTAKKRIGVLVPVFSKRCS